MPVIETTVNDPSNIMDPNSQEDVLGKKSSDFGPKIKEDIQTTDNENICNKTQDISAYDSQGDNFYNTVEVQNNNTRRSVETPVSTYSADDLINFDQSIRLSVEQRYSNGSNSNQLNETFDIGAIPITNKHLKVKTSDLLSVSGISGRYSTDYNYNDSNYNDSKIIEDDENEFFCASDGVRAEENSGEFLPATIALDQISCITRGENQNILTFSVVDIEEGEKIKHFDSILHETTIKESDNLKLEGNNISSLEEATENSNFTDNLDKTNQKENLNFETVSDKSVKSDTVESGIVETKRFGENLNIATETVPETFVESDSVESGTVETKTSGENLNIATETVPETFVESGTVETKRSGENLNITTETVPETFVESDTVESGPVETKRSGENLNITTETVPETFVESDTVESGTVKTKRSGENLNITTETVPETSVESGTVETNRSRENLNLTSATENEILINIETLPEKSLDSGADNINKSKENLNFSFETVSKTFVESGTLEAYRSNENLDLSIDIRSENSIKSGIVDTNRSKENIILTNETILEKSLKSETVEINRSRETTPDKTKEKITWSQESIDCDFKMTDIVEKLNQQQAEISDLKLKLNAAQQHNATLELQIRQNEEIVIKTQAEALRTEQNYQQEVKQLKEKLNENSKIIEKDRIRELEEQVKDGKTREAKLLAEISQRTKDDVNYEKIVDQCELKLKARLAEIKKLQEENETTRNHLTNLELAFSDVHSKYEKTKASLEGVKANEEALLTDLELAQSTNIQHEERYESLKAHARTQIEKSNKEIHTMKEQHEVEINKLKAFIKRLEIKVSSLEVSLQQKTEECEQLSALCDEVTGKRV